jgi:hypothetical protein
VTFTPNPASGATYDAHIPGHEDVVSRRGWVLWTDAEHALVYECADPDTPDADGATCGPSQRAVFLLGRRPTLAQDTLDAVLAYLKAMDTAACGVTRQDFERIPHDGKTVTY